MEINFNHLLLLIGTNPLPNYVTASYFLDKNDSLSDITLIHTKDTFDIARRLAQILKKIKPKVSHHLCGLTDIGNAVKMRDELREQIPFQGGDVFHLNYTGGTKNMSVQTYLAVYDATDFTETTFSYLDAHDFKLKYDNGKMTTQDLRASIDIDFKDLLFLHDCQATDPDDHIDWSKANDIIKAFLEHHQIFDFIGWKNSVIREIFYKNEKLFKPDAVSLADLKPEHPFFPQVEKLIAQFPEEQAWKFDAEGNLEIPDTREEFKKGKGRFAKGIFYLDGGWLEYYIFKLIEDQVREEKLDFEILNNRRIFKGQAKKDFEIDIMILNGYQLYGISATTTTREFLCKSKAFEIYHRTHQIGGDEARALLISPLAEDVKIKIEQDLETDTGGQAKLKIMGIRDLKPKNLWQEIKNYISGE